MPEFSYPVRIRTPKGFDITVTPTVSTGHITFQDNEILSNMLSEIPGLYARHEYGWEFALRCTDPEALQRVGLSDALADLVSKFKALDYDHLNIDRDGQVIEGLPQFEW